jgi:hypothetical protein
MPTGLRWSAGQLQCSQEHHPSEDSVSSCAKLVVKRVILALIKQFVGPCLSKNSKSVTCGVSLQSSCNIIFVGPQHGNCFMPFFDHLIF